MIPYLVLVLILLFVAQEKLMTPKHEG